MTVEAPAKLNLSLRVIRRRDDGFHEIDSVMVTLPGLHDRITITGADEDRFECDEPGVPTDGSNLAMKALAVFREETGEMDPLAVKLEKRIPHGAGLGGGSSDAAAMLRALDTHFGTKLGVDALVELAARIGSDIPFFLGPPVGRVLGRGEILEPGPELPELQVVLLKPSFGVSTPDAYRRWKDAPAVADVDFAPQVLDWGELVNDLERPVFGKHLFLAEMREWLRARPEVAGALMSGSGSTVFAVLEDPGKAGEVISAAKEELDPTLWAWSGKTGSGVFQAPEGMPE
ncbi:4-(cytidine 5'-diphospho)-2-C-methyl-D-erythritol kinase [Haloferula helveola]|uniref:4-(cytidine 5'-diphospho)-2-C-methyl-D-erythritol kinase n=1 Tax=Haloferula helveola TaxID=490095 RepID=UPI0030D44800